MQPNPNPPHPYENRRPYRYAHLAFVVTSLLCFTLLTGVLVMWARSYLHVDSWVVSSMVQPTNPPVAFVSPVSGLMMRPEFSKSPLNHLRHLPTWHSESGWFYIPRFSLWFVRGFAKSRRNLVSIPAENVRTHLAAIGSLAVPYWAVAAVAAVCPAVWLWRFRRMRFSDQPIRFGVGQIMGGTTAASIAMFGYREIGLAGILLMANVLLAAVPAYLFARWSVRPEVATLRFPSRLGSVVLFLWSCVAAMYFAHQIVYQHAVTEAQNKRCQEPNPKMVPDTLFPSRLAQRALASPKASRITCSESSAEKHKSS